MGKFNCINSRRLAKIIGDSLRPAVTASGIHSNIEPHILDAMRKIAVKSSDIGNKRAASFYSTYDSNYNKDFKAKVNLSLLSLLMKNGFSMEDSLAYLKTNFPESKIDKALEKVSSIIDREVNPNKENEENATSLREKLTDSDVGGRDFVMDFSESEFDSRLVSLRVGEKGVTKVKHIIDAYFNGDSNMYNVFVKYSKSYLSGLLIDQSAHNSKGLDVSEEAVRSVLYAIANGNFKNNIPYGSYGSLMANGINDDVSNYFNHVLSQNLTLFVKKYIDFIDIDGDIEKGNTDFSNVTLDNSVNVNTGFSSNIDTLGQNTKSIVFFLETTPRLISVSKLNKLERERYFGSDRVPEGVKYVQSKDNPYLTKADYDQLDLFEKGDIVEKDVFVQKLADSGNDIAFSLYSRFYSDGAIEYFNLQGIKQTVFGLDGFEGETNADAVTVVASRLFSKQKKNIIKESKNDNVYNDSVLQTDGQIALGINASFNSTFNAEGDINSDISDSLEFNEDRKGNLKLSMNGINLSFNLQEISDMNNISDGKILFQLRDVDMDMDLEDAEYIENLISVMRTLGFDNRLATQSFLNNTSQAELKSMIATAMYSAYANTQLLFGADMQGSDIVNTNNISNYNNNIGNIKYINTAALMQHYMSTMMSHLINVVGVEGERQISLPNNTKVSGVDLRKSLHVAYDSGADFFEGNIYSNGEYTYTGTGLITGFTEGSDYFKFNQMTEKGIFKVLIDKLFIGKIRATANTFYMKTYSSERDSREAHEVSSSDSPIKVNDNMKIDHSYYTNKIRSVREQNIKNTGKLLNTKYKSQFDPNNEISKRVFAKLGLSSDLLVKLNDQLNEVGDTEDLTFIDAFIKSLPEQLDITEQETISLLSKLNLSPGIHFSKKTLGLRKSLVYEYNTYTNEDRTLANRLIRYELDTRVGYIKSKGYRFSDTVKDNLSKILETNTLTNSQVMHIALSSYSYQNMLHTSAINHIAFGSMAQFKDDISQDDINKITLKEKSLAKAYNKEHKDDKNFKKRDGNYIEEQVNMQTYYASMANSITDFYKRTGTATSSHISPVLIKNGQQGRGLRRDMIVSHINSHEKSNAIFGSMANENTETNDGQSFVHPNARLMYSHSLGGQFDKYADENIPVKSSNYSMQADNGGFYVQKESQANLYGHEGIGYSDYQMLIKMNSSVLYNNGDTLTINVPEIKKVAVTENDVTEFIYELTGGVAKLDAKHLQDVYDYYGGFSSNLDVVGIVQEALYMNPYITEKFISALIDVSAVKSMQQSVNEVGALDDDKGMLLYHNLDMKDFGIILSKNKHAFERKIHIATQIINLGAGSSIVEGTNIGDAFASISHMGEKKLSDKLRIVIAKVADSKGEFNAEAKRALGEIKINDKLAFEYMEEKVITDHKYLPFIKLIYNMYLTELAKDNIDKARNSDDVIQKLSGITSNFNLAQIKSLSESMVRTEFHKSTLDYTTNGIESILTSVYDKVKLHKSRNGRWVFKNDIADYDNEIDLKFGLFPTYGERFLVVAEDNSNYLINAEEFETLKEEGELGNYRVFTNRTSQKITIKRITPEYRSQLLDNDKTIERDGETYIVKTDVFTINDLRNEDLVIYQSDDMFDEDYISVDVISSSVPTNQEYLLAYKNIESGEIVYITPKHKIDFEYASEGGYAFIGYVNDIITERNLNYYKFIDDNGNDVEESSQWKSLNYFENNGEFKSYYKSIPEEAFKVIHFNFGSENISKSTTTDEAYSLYLSADKKTKELVNKEFSNHLVTLGISPKVKGFKNKRTIKKEKLKIFFRSLLLGELQNGNYDMSQPEVIMGAPFAKTFGIPEGTTIFDIYGDDNDPGVMLDNAKSFFNDIVTIDDVDGLYKKYFVFDENSIYKTANSIEQDLAKNPNDDILKELGVIYQEAIELHKSGKTHLDQLDRVTTSLNSLSNNLIKEIADNRATNLDEALNVIVTKIPLQSKQSTSYSRIMEFNWDMGNTIFISDGQYKVMGADNDADTTNVMTYVYRKNGTKYDYDEYIVDGRIEGFNGESLLSKIENDPENQTEIINEHINNLKFTSTVLEVKLKEIENAIYSSMANGFSNTEIEKAISKAKNKLYNDFSKSMQNFIIDQMKEIYTSLDNVFEIQSVMSSDILGAILEEKTGGKYDSDLDSKDMVNTDYQLAIVQEITENAINEGAMALGKIINIEAYSAMMNRAVNGRVLKSTLNMTFTDPDTGEIIEMKSDGLFDNDLAKKNGLEGKVFELNYEIKKKLIDKKAKKEHDKRCS